VWGLENSEEAFHWQRVQWNSHSTPWKTLRALTKCAHSTQKKKNNNKINKQEKQTFAIVITFFHILLFTNRGRVWEILGWSLTLPATFHLAFNEHVKC